MKDSYKRCINFGRLLNKLNFNRKNNYIHNNQTFDKNSSFRKDCSSLNIIKPEIEYVTKLDFFIPNTPDLKRRKKLNSSVENRIYENKLENRRKELENKIFKIKEDLKPLNDDLTKIISEIDNLKLDYEILQNNKTCSIIEKTIKKNLMINTIISPRANMNSINYLPFLLKRNNNIDKKSKIDSILSQHKKNMRSKKNYTLMKATQLKEQKKEIVNKIKSYETDLKIFREEKNKIKYELLSHYNTILHEGKDIRKDGLSWIIQAIWNLKCKVLPSYLPIFLDEESIKFLFNFANKKNKLNDLIKLVQKLSKKINEDKNNINKNNKNNKNNEYILKKTNTIDPGIYYRNTHENFFEENKVNNKWAFSTLMHKINLNNNNININSNFNNNIDTDRIIKKGNDIDIDNNKENDMNSKNSINNSNNNNKIRNSFSFNKMVYKTCSNIPNFNYKEKEKEKIELYNDKNIIEKNIHILKKEIKNLIENELQRLNQCFDKEGYENKYNIDKNKFICTVIGENNIKDEINKNISNRKNFLNILKKIKITNINE